MMSLSLRSLNGGSTDVDDRAVLYVFHGATQHFVRKRRGIAFAEKNEAKHVYDGVDFRPVEVDVRETVRALFQIDKQRRDGICDHRTPGKEDFMATLFTTKDVQLLSEIRRVSTIDFD